MTCPSPLSRSGTMLPTPPPQANFRHLALNRPRPEQSSSLWNKQLAGHLSLNVFPACQGHLPRRRPQPPRGSSCARPRSETNANTGRTAHAPAPRLLRAQVQFYSFSLRSAIFFPYRPSHVGGVDAAQRQDHGAAASLSFPAFLIWSRMSCVARCLL